MTRLLITAAAARELEAAPLAAERRTLVTRISELAAPERASGEPISARAGRLRVGGWTVVYRRRRDAVVICAVRAAGITESNERSEGTR